MTWRMRCILKVTTPKPRSCIVSVWRLGRSTLGETYPDTLSSLNNLAIAVAQQGNYAEAEKLHRECVDGTEKVLGKGHPNTVTWKKNLDICLRKMKS